MGVFFAQASATLPVLLDVIWNYHFDPGHVTWEQIAVRTHLDDWPAAAARILIADHPRDFNSFPEERQAIHKLHHQANTWQPGDFVCHFSGIGAPKLTELIALYRRALVSQSWRDGLYPIRQRGSGHSTYNARLLRPGFAQSVDNPQELVFLKRIPR